MTENQMFDEIRMQMRTNGVPVIAALARTLTKAGVELPPFDDAQKILYVRCDAMPFQSITTIGYLARINGLKVEIIALPRKVEIAGAMETISTPYLLITSR